MTRLHLWIMGTLAAGGGVSIVGTGSCQAGPAQRRGIGGNVANAQSRAYISVEKPLTAGLRQTLPLASVEAAADERHLMLRAIFAFVSLVCLALALVAGVLDATRSIADSTLVLTPLHDDWMRFSPNSLAVVKSALSDFVHPFLWDPVFVTLIKAPTWAAFAVLWILFATGARRQKARWQENFGA